MSVSSRWSTILVFIHPSSISWQVTLIKSVALQAISNNDLIGARAATIILKICRKPRARKLYIQNNKDVIEEFWERRILLGIFYILKYMWDFIDINFSNRIVNNRIVISNRTII